MFVSAIDAIQAGRRTGEHADEHIVCVSIAGEDVLVKGIFPAELVDFFLEVDEKVVIILLVAEVLLIRRIVAHIFHDAAGQLHRRALVACIVVIMALDLTGICTNGEECEEVVGDVVLQDGRINIM